MDLVHDFEAVDLVMSAVVPLLASVSSPLHLHLVLERGHVQRVAAPLSHRTLRRNLVLATLFVRC